MTEARPVRRRGAIGLVLAMLLVIAVAAPALAHAETYRFQGEQAMASWQQDDDRNTWVLIGAFDGVFQNPPGSPQDAQDALVGVVQSWCDEDEDELVLRGFFGFGETASLSVDHARLSDAEVDGELTLHGSDYRVPDCDDPVFDDGEFEELGEFDVEVAAGWEAVSDVKTDQDRFHYEFGDVKLRSHDMERYRDAGAVGTLTGLEEHGVDPDLGESDGPYDRIASFNSIAVAIGHH